MTIQGELSLSTIYHLDVGCADASIITTSACFLVDTHGIESYSHLLPANKRIRGVFITHQHRDHYSGLDYLYRNGFQIDWLIYSPYKRRRSDNSVTIEEWNEFNDFRDKFVRKGTQTRTPYRQDTFDKPFWSTNGCSFEIIGPHKSVADSPTRELHDACLVIKAIVNHRKCLFAGDASDENLQKIADTTKNYCNDILHVSHHGSINGACLDFVKKCNAEYSVVSTKNGVYSNVPHPKAMQRYRNHTSKKVYRTDVDGSIKWDAKAN